MPDFYVSFRHLLIQFSPYLVLKLVKFFDLLFLDVLELLLKPSVFLFSVGQLLSQFILQLARKIAKPSDELFLWLIGC